MNHSTPSINTPVISTTSTTSPHQSQQDTHHTGNISQLPSYTHHVNTCIHPPITTNHHKVKTKQIKLSYAHALTSNLKYNPYGNASQAKAQSHISKNQSIQTNLQNNIITNDTSPPPLPKKKIKAEYVI